MEITKVADGVYQLRLVTQTGSVFAEVSVPASISDGGADDPGNTISRRAATSAIFDLLGEMIDIGNGESTST